MAQTTLSVRMDQDVKKQLDALCADVGLSLIHISEPTRPY